MSREVRFSAAAEKFLEKLRDKTLTAKLIAKIRTLADDPRPPECKKLVSETPDLYRVRVGEYRIVYQVQDAALRILVLAIGHRREIYR